MPGSAIAPRHATLVDLLRHQATAQGDKTAFTLVTDRGRQAAGLSFAALDREARRLAARLADRARPGDRALLVFPAGTEFMIAFFACLYAGVIAVPLMPPRRRRLRHSTFAITADCAPAAALTTPELRAEMTREFADQLDADRWFDTGGGAAGSTEDGWQPPPVAAEGLALLQYTSGSTSQPKGVMVAHGNLLANLEMMRRVYGTDPAATAVSWVPHYHDMGLILNQLHSLYAGSTCLLLPPLRFVQHPWLWLQTISDHRAVISASPNFGYDLCVSTFDPATMDGVDLSSWQIAINGAEPVRPATLQKFAATFAPYGFRPAAITPSYGMAEATVLVSARRGGGTATLPASRTGLLDRRLTVPADGEDAQPVVSCGPALPGESLRIVDPATLAPCAEGEIGEIWVAGPNVATGYWEKPDASTATFQARCHGDDAAYLRTGDLGVLRGGELYVMGRLKDMIVIRGANLYPQDVEYVVEHCDPALRENCCVAFSVTVDDQERLVVVQEVQRHLRRHLDGDAITAAIRRAVVQEFEVMVHAVVLVAPGTVPKTSSGKVQRQLVRRRYLAGELTPLTSGPDVRAAGPAADQPALPTA